MLKDKIDAVFCIIGFFACLLGLIWWFAGRQPYVTVEDPTDPVLVYYTPKWNGWDRWFLKWDFHLPRELKEAYPHANGFWYVGHRYLTIPKKDLPPVDPDNLEKSISEWDKYFKYEWVPLGWKLPRR